MLASDYVALNPSFILACEKIAARRIERHLLIVKTRTGNPPVLDPVDFDEHVAEVVQQALLAADNEHYMAIEPDSPESRIVMAIAQSVRRVFKRMRIEGSVQVNRIDRRKTGKKTWKSIPVQSRSAIEHADSSVSLAFTEAFARQLNATVVRMADTLEGGFTFQTLDVWRAIQDPAILCGQRSIADTLDVALATGLNRRTVQRELSKIENVAVDLLE
jgi:hypothetical protein